MLHGPAKRRQMARSILASRARERARAQLRTVHRDHRRSVAKKLRADARRVGRNDGAFDLGDDRATRITGSVTSSSTVGSRTP